MVHRFFLPGAFMAAIWIFPIPTARAAEGDKAGPAINDLSLEIEALQGLRAFRMTLAQMKKLQKVAEETASKPRRKEPKVSAEFRKALVALRQALGDGKENDKIEQLEEELDELRETDEPTLDDGVEVTAAARRRAPEVLRFLSAPQVANYLAGIADDIHDPLEMLYDALEQTRELKAKEWKEYRDAVAGEVGRLVAGLDEAKSGKVVGKVVVFLSNARELKEEDFQTQRQELRKEARQIAGAAHPTDVLKHTLEHALAELLSNPRLGEALKAGLK